MSYMFLDLAGTIERLDGELELMHEIANDFIQGAAEHLTKIDTAIASRQAKNLEHSAHTFKSTIAIFGAAKLVAQMQQIENTGASGTCDGTAEMFAQAKTMLQQLIVEIKSAIIEPQSKAG